MACSCGIFRRAISIAAYAASISMCAIVRNGFLEIVLVSPGIHGFVGIGMRPGYLRRSSIAVAEDVTIRRSGLWGICRVYRVLCGRPALILIAVAVASSVDADRPLLPLDAAARPPFRRAEGHTRRRHGGPDARMRPRRSVSESDRARRAGRSSRSVGGSFGRRAIRDRRRAHGALRFLAGVPSASGSARSRGGTSKMIFVERVECQFRRRQVGRPAP